jgi:hypothetical protein
MIAVVCCCLYTVIFKYIAIYVVTFVCYIQIYCYTVASFSVKYLVLCMYIFSGGGVQVHVLYRGLVVRC